MENRIPEILGMIIALQDAVRAICSTHPDPHALAHAFQQQKEETLALLLAQPVPDVSLTVYEDFVARLGPVPDV